VSYRTFHLGLFIMQPSLGAALNVSPRPSVRPSARLSVGPSVQCLRFSRNRKTVETSKCSCNIALDNNKSGNKFMVYIKVKVTENDNVRIVLCAYLCQKWTDYVKPRPKLYTYGRIQFTTENASFCDNL